MTTDCPSQLTILQAKQGSPVDLERMQNAILCHLLEELRALQVESNMQVHKLTQLIERRTQVFSPAKAYSHETYNSRGNVILLFRSIQISSTNRFAVAAISTDSNPILQPLASLSIFPETPPWLRLGPWRILEYMKWKRIPFKVSYVHPQNHLRHQDLGQRLIWSCHQCLRFLRKVCL